MKTLLLMCACFSAALSADVFLDFMDPAACGPAGTGPATPLAVFAEPPTTIQSETFNFTDASQPGYLPNRLCQWLITGDVNAGLALRFINFSMELCSDCNCDYVRVFDGVDDTGTPLTTGGFDSRICGSPDAADNPYAANVYASSTNSLFVELVTDDSTEHHGFFARVGSQYDNTACPGPMMLDSTSRDFILMTLDYPVPYQNSAVCEWQITAPAGQRVRLNFNDFNTGTVNVGCQDDYIEVLDGDSTGVSAGIWWGPGTPATLTSSGTMMYVKFQSDANNRFPGFLASYEFVV